MLRRMPPRRLPPGRMRPERLSPERVRPWGRHNEGNQHMLVGSAMHEDRGVGDSGQAA